MSVSVYNIANGTIESGEVSLPASVFGVAPQHDLIHQVVRVLLLNQRKPWAHAKDRSEVRGGGAKPWRQKGTGRARHGSRRSPIWVGGGVTFGPHKGRALRRSINKKMKQAALRMVLTAKQEDGYVVAVDRWPFATVSTKAAEQALRWIGNQHYGDASALEKGVMLVVAGKDPVADKRIRLSARNIPDVIVARADNLSLLDILRVPFMIIVKDALDVIEETYGK